MMLPRDTDPLRPADTDLWDPSAGEWVRRPAPIAFVVVLTAILAAALGLVVGIGIGQALGRSTMAPGVAGSDAKAAARDDNGSHPIIGPQSPGQGPARAGASVSSVGAETAGGPQPLPQPTGAEPPAAVGGVATFVDPKYGPAYLALPEGPGVTVTIHGPHGSVTRTSTDAGPSLERQRAGIVADVSFEDFHRLCGCDPWLVGRIPVSVEYLGPTPPATSTEGGAP